MVFSNKLQDGFEYYLEDIDCEVCLHAMKKSKKHIFRCREKYCRYKDIRTDAVINGRLERKKGHFNEFHDRTLRDQVPL